MVIGGDGPERGALEALVRQLGLADRVDFRGWIDPAAVPEFLECGTIMLMPSRWEGLPLAGIQAALMARPIVATRVGGLPELVEDGVTGRLCDADPAALAAATAALLVDPARAMQIGQAGRERAQRLFGWRQCVDSYDQMYQKVARELGHAGSG
jgi:glycosyltransferase involved in cell wall biosynthesis